MPYSSTLLIKSQIIGDSTCFLKNTTFVIMKFDLVQKIFSPQEYIHMFVVPSNKWQRNLDLMDHNGI